jgi:hypothetical protein
MPDKLTYFIFICLVISFNIALHAIKLQGFEILLRWGKRLEHLQQLPATLIL